MASSRDFSWYRLAMWASLAITVYMVLIGEKYLLRMVEVETKMNQVFYSEEVAKNAEERGSYWFELAFVRTEIMKYSFDLFIPTEQQMRDASDMERASAPVFNWFEGRLRALWTLVWATFTRASSVLLWLPYSVLILTPWLVDGLVQRERSKHTFQFSSPVRHRYAMMGLVLMPVVFFVLLMAPIAMHPLVTPIILFGAGMMLQVAAANFMKRA